MALMAALYFVMYSGVALWAAGRIRVVWSLGNTNSFTVFDNAGGQHALVLTAFLVSCMPLLAATHVEMSGAVIGAAKAAGRAVKLAVV